MSRLIQLSRKATTTTTTFSSLLSNPNNVLQSRTYYMSQLFPKSNTSFQLTTGNAITADIVRLTDDILLVDSGIGTPKTCLEDELVGANKNKIRFQNRVGFLDLVSGESPIKQQVLERFFIDLVAGDKIAKERAAARFNDLVGGGGDVDGGNDSGVDFVLPRRYRQKRVTMELEKVWRTNTKVKGFYVGRNRSGYAVAIAGYVAFFPYRPVMSGMGRRLLKDRFIVESVNFKTGNIVVL